jgi:hypothetical protein
MNDTATIEIGGDQLIELFVIGFSLEACEAHEDPQG